MFKVLVDFKKAKFELIEKALYLEKSIHSISARLMLLSSCFPPIKIIIILSSRGKYSAYWLRFERFIHPHILGS
jgi:hypothetical protein